MPQNPPEFGQLIQALNREKVSFVVVGELAIVLHGGNISIRYDTELAIGREPEDTAAIVRALAPFNPRPFSIDEVANFSWDARSIFGDVVSLLTDAGEVDLVRTSLGVDSFKGLCSRAVTRIVFGETILVASIDDLIAMKRSADRPKDRDHIRLLEAIRDLEQA